MNSVTESIRKPLMRPEEFWLQYHRSRVLIAENFSSLAWVALDILKNMPQPVGQVCGRISSGNRTIEENMKIFQQAIERLCWENYIFNQLPFETKMQKLIGSRQEKGHPHDLLEEFYLPIFESGLIKKLFFLRGWESAWEHEKAKLLGIPIFYLDDDFQIRLSPLD